MNTVGAYIFRQTALPCLFFTFMLTVVVWLTQSLKMLDLIINGGQSLLTFFYLVILVLPSLLTVIVPIALFCGVLYGLHRFYSDSEITVMWSAGIGPWALAKPILVLALIVTMANYALGLYFMPAGYRAMKDRIYEIRSDLAAAFIREGQFTTKIDGLTVYISQAPTGGDLKGILVHDNRNPERPRTYMAERGVFWKTPDGPRLVMHNGEVQEMTNRDGNLQSLRFESSILDLGQFEGDQNGRNARDLSERYLGELFYPEAEQREKQRKYQRFVAEGHARLATPLYNFTFALIAFIAVLGGTFSRRGYTSRIIYAMGAVLMLRLAGFGVQSWAADAAWVNGLQYALPVLSIAVCIMIINETPPFDRRRRGLHELKAPSRDDAAEPAGG